MSITGKRGTSFTKNTRKGIQHVAVKSGVDILKLHDAVIKEREKLFPKEIEIPKKPTLYKPKSEKKPKFLVSLKTKMHKKVYIEYLNTVDLSDKKFLNFINKFKIPSVVMEKILTEGINNNWK